MDQSSQSNRVWRSASKLSWLLAAISMAITGSYEVPAIGPQDETTAAARHCIANVRNYGAAGDGLTLDMAAIQRAIDACAKSGGGKVIIPVGKYRSGTLHLRSNVSIIFEEGAVLIGSDDLDDYVQPDRSHYVHWTGSRRVFLYGLKVDNVSIEGRGTINGNRVREKSGNRGPLTILMEHASNLVLKDVSVTRAPGWAVTFFDCKHVQVLGVRTKDVMADGINAVSSQDVLYDGVVIDGSGDDPMCLKNEGPQLPGGYVTRNITIRNTEVSNTTHPGFKIGTGTYGTFENIVLEDSAFDLPGDFFVIQLMRPSLPGESERFIRQVRVRRVNVRDAARFCDITAIGVEKPIISDLQFEDVRFRGGAVDSRILGTEACPVGRIGLKNVSVQATRSANAWLYLRNVQNLRVEQSSLDLPGTRSAVVAQSSGKLQFAGIRIPRMVGDGPVFELVNVREASIASIQTPTVRNLILVSGAASDRIQLESGEWANAREPLLAAADVVAGALAPMAKAEVVELSVPKRIKPNDAVAAVARVRNPGPAGAFRLSLSADQREVGAHWSWLGADGEAQVSLSGRPFYRAGRYTLRAGTISRVLHVVKTPAAIRYGDYCEMESPVAPGAVTRVVVPLRNWGVSFSNTYFRKATRGCFKWRTSQTGPLQHSEMCPGASCYIATVL